MVVRSFVEQKTYYGLVALFRLVQRRKPRSGQVLSRKLIDTVKSSSNPIMLELESQLSNIIWYSYSRIIHGSWILSHHSHDIWTCFQFYINPLAKGKICTFVTGIFKKHFEGILLSIAFSNLGLEPWLLFMLLLTFHSFI